MEDVSHTCQGHDLLAVEELLAEVYALASAVYEAVDEEPVNGTRCCEAGGVHLRPELVILHFQRVSHRIEHLHESCG